MSTEEWRPTACNLCYANCGVLVRLDESGRNIVKVRGDRAHPGSQGYTCNKAAQINYYQNGRDRLSSPLRRRPDGTFEAVSWETAIVEVAARLEGIRDTYGGDKLFYYGGGGQGNHLGGSYASSVGPVLQASYSSNALAQEKSGLAWLNGRMLRGSWHGDFDTCDVAIIIGKNPWQSNGMQRARIRMRDIGRDPARTLIVMDPRRTETAELADIHLAVKPGRDVWCIAAILGHLVKTERHAREWLAEHATGAERVLEQLGDVPVADYAAFAGIPLAQIEQAASAIAGTDRIAVTEDLGIEMAPNSALCTYLNILLFLLPGAFAAPGGTHLVTGIAGGYMVDGDGAEEVVDGYGVSWQKTPVTGARMIQGMMPCNSIPEEILTDHPNRFRGAIVESANPLHSLADTRRFEAAFDALEFVVVIDVAMTETAQLADYVLPASSTFEKCEATFYPQEFPENFFHLRRRLIDPLPGTLPEAEIYARLMEALGVFEPGELDELARAAEAGYLVYAEAMTEALASPKIATHLNYVLHRTLGATLPDDAREAASLWANCHQLAATIPDHLRAAGHKGEGLALGIELFEKILASESGVVLLKGEPGDATQWRRPDGKVNLLVGEMSDELDRLAEYRMPERDDAFPMLLCAGERGSYTANTIIRDPGWMQSNNPDSLSVHPADAARLGLADAGSARLVTKRGEAVVQVEFNDRMQEGSISLPNGLGTVYPDAAGRPMRTGVHLNELTDLQDRDPWVGTPWHKHVRARLEPV